MVKIQNYRTHPGPRAQLTKDPPDLDPYPHQLFSDIPTRLFYSTRTWQILKVLKMSENT
jgi:hypothetical protein